MEKRRWKRAESSDASTTWGSSSSSTNNNRPAMRSILKSSESASAAVVPSSSSTACPASLCWSTPRLGTRIRHANAKAFSPAQRRQHSIDAKLPVTSSTTCRAVTFFLASESSDSSFAADKTEEVKLGDKLPRQHRFCRQNSSSFRRTSLPVQSNIARQNLLLQSQVNSARGILMDLLTANRRDLSPDVAACLKAVTALLNPAASPAAQQAYAAGGCANVGAANAALSLSELGVPSVVESPYSGEVRVALTAKPRVSNITFSTVTSATGLPTIAAEPSRPRSSSYWKPSHAHTIQNHGGHHGGGIATNFSNSLPQRINLYEYEDELHGEQQQHVEQIAPNDMAWKEQQHNEVGDQHKQQQRRRSQRLVNNNEDSGEPNGQAVQQQQQQQQQQQRLLNHNREKNRENPTVEEEEGNQQQQQQREAGATSSSTPKHPPFTATSSRRTSAIDDSEQHQQHEGGGGGASAVVGAGGAVFQQQLSSGSGDNTSLSSVATSTATTATSATTAPCAHHAQSVDSDDMTGQSTKRGFSSTLSHHKRADGAGTVVELAKTKSTADGGQREKSKSPRGRHSAGREEEESCSSEQLQPSSAFGTVPSKDGRQHGAGGDVPTVYKAVNGTTFDRVELERDPALGQIQEWSFPIFRLAEKHKRTVLSRLTYAIFKEADLFRTFKISYTKFFNFFHALESGYWDIPYHNRIHAADVLHGTYYLTCHPVHAFCSYHSSELEDEDELEEDEENDTTTDAASSTEQPLNNHNGQPTASTTNGGGRHVLRQQQSTATTGATHRNCEAHPQQQQQTFDSSAAVALAQSMSPLELMALYTAAAMHDYDHPGRTNAFLVASEDRKAILYNDRSVLENHHAAESWRLLNSHAQFQFIENLDSAETKRFRYLVLEYILATDLKQHFDIIMQFNERVPDMDLNNESDRVLISLMLIKFADINSPAKPYSLHRQWTERICQEFYEQGDEEKKRKMPVSPYMDRNEPAVAKLQDSFIAHIVNPLAIALNEAGLFPVLPGLPESELIINLKHNHQKWLHQIEAEQHNQQQKEGSASSAASTVESGADGRHDGAQSNNNNFGAGGEAEIVLNNGGVKLPLFNNCSPAASSPSLLAKRNASGKNCGGGDVPSAPRSGGRAVTIAPTPAAATSSSHFVPSGGELRSREGSAEEMNDENAGGSSSARGQAK